MSAPRSVRLEVLRATVKAAAEARTLRTVAAEIGMSVAGLHAFLGGGHPRPGTLKKLSAWYLRHPVTTGEADTELAAAALDVLLAGIPKDKREAARRRVLESVRAAHGRRCAAATVGIRVTE